jgi:UPF0755 protein
VKKRIILSILVLLLTALSIFGWIFFGPSVSSANAKYIYIRPGDNYASVKQQLVDKKIISGSGTFDLIAKRLQFRDPVKPGRYEVKNGSSLYDLVKMLRRGNQSPVNFTVVKLNTVEDLASRISKNFEVDSITAIRYLTNADSMHSFGLDSLTVMTAVIPNTYSIFWNSSPAKIFKKLFSEQEKFWTEERKSKAAAINLSPKQVYTLASIVEQETEKAEDKGKIASVYLNRLETGMKLQADPTLKFALRNFTLNRILNIHKEVASAYNTYKNTGLPPGPICTPSAATIDAVLNAPTTSYLFFAAKPDYSGYSNFSSTYEEHEVNARAYQEWLTVEQNKKKKP